MKNIHQKGFKIGIFDLIKILIKYQSKSKLVNDLRDIYQNLEDLCNDVKRKKIDKDVVFDVTNELESSLKGYWVGTNYEKMEAYNFFDTCDSYCPKIYNFTHDQNQGDNMFVVGEELLDTITKKEIKKKIIINRIPELKDIKLMMYNVQNECKCCS